MSRSGIYLLLAIIGAVVPWIFFADFFAAEGVAGNFVGALFANGAAGGFSADLLVTSLVFWILLFSEARQGRIARPWLYVVINVVIGLSCALPLFLWQRERAASRGQTEERSSS